MERANFSLRLLPSLLSALQRIAEQENCSVNQLINVAVAEKIAVLDERRWLERRDKALNKPAFDWDKAGGDLAPQDGDEIPKKVHRPVKTVRR